jgi:hypothetical protein
MNYTNLFFSIITLLFIGYAQRTFAMSAERANESLFRACEKGRSVKHVASLIKQGANVNAQDKDKHKPLHIACAFGHIELVKFLIGQGADINFRMRGFTTPLHCAVLAQHAHIVRYLLNAGADIDVLNRQGFTAFELACKYRICAIIELFPGQSSEDSELGDGLYDGFEVLATPVDCI